MPLSIEEHEQRAAHMESLLQQVSLFPDPDLRATTEALIGDILDLHGEGLARILTLIVEAGDEALVEQLVNDGLVSSLLLLHGVHPVDLETRVRRALEALSVSLNGTIALTRIAEGIAYVRLAGSCHDCSASPEILRTTIEEAVSQAAPELEKVEIEEAAAKKAVRVTFVAPRRHRERENGHASISSS